MSSSESNDRPQPEEKSSSTALIKVEVSNLIDLKPAGKLGERIMELIFGGIARVYNDATTVWRAEKQSKATLIRAETEVRTAAITAFPDPMTVEGRAALRLKHESVRHQENIEQVVHHAVEYADEQEAAGKAYVSNQTPPVDEGWLLQFNDIGRKATKEEMQRLLGKVLAQEVAQPGKFSIRAIMVLTTISRAEAEAFHKLCQLYVKGFDIPWIRKDWLSDTTKRYFGLSYDEILLCRSAGLVYENDTLMRFFEISPIPQMYIYAGQPLMLVSEEVKKISIAVLALTTVGRELAEIIEIAFNRSFFDDLKSHLNTMGIKALGISEINKLVVNPKA